MADTLVEFYHLMGPHIVDHKADIPGLSMFGIINLTPCLGYKSEIYIWDSLF